MQEKDLSWEIKLSRYSIILGWRNRKFHAFLSRRETFDWTNRYRRATLLSGGDAAWMAGDAEKIRLSREEDLYKQEMIRLEKDLTWVTMRLRIEKPTARLKVRSLTVCKFFSELESTVEELRGNVINRKTRVNMSDVENMALILSKSRWATQSMERDAIVTSRG